jgi:predicted nucleic acid-binding Zn ribbon protein
VSVVRPVWAKTCRVCSIKFRTQSNRQVTCSKACYEWGRKYPGSPRPANLPCPACGGPVTKRASTTYCSARCRNAAGKRKRGHNGRPVTSDYQVFTECRHCGVPLAGKKAGTQFCSAECEIREYNYPGSFALRASRRCERCGDPLAASERINRRYCSVRCQVYANQDIRRARKRGLPAERFSEVEIFERDGWVCHLCDGDVNPAVRTGPMMASLDHLIPFTVPGCPGHVRSNVALAHLTCNISKRDRVRPKDWALHYRLAGAGPRPPL